MNTAFTGHEGRWQARLGKLRDVVRQELVARQLAGELGPPPVRIIDLGCGQGTQAVRLAQRGYEVTGVDASAELPGRFERDLAGVPAEVRARVPPPDLEALLACEVRTVEVRPRARRSLRQLDPSVGGPGMCGQSWYVPLFR